MAERIESNIAVNKILFPGENIGVGSINERANIGFFPYLSATFRDNSLNLLYNLSLTSSSSMLVCSSSESSSDGRSDFDLIKSSVEAVRIKLAESDNG